MATMQHSAQEELAAAIQAERAAWAKVKDKLPGSPGYDAALWALWREAVGRCHAVRQSMRSATSAPEEGESPARPAGADH